MRLEGSQVQPVSKADPERKFRAVRTTRLTRSRSPFIVLMTPAYPKCKIWHCILVYIGKLEHTSFSFQCRAVSLHISPFRKGGKGTCRIRTYIAEYGRKITYKTAFICHDVGEYKLRGVFFEAADIKRHWLTKNHAQENKHITIYGDRAWEQG